MVVRELTFVMVLFIISYGFFLLEVVSLDLILKVKFVGIFFFYFKEKNDMWGLLVNICDLFYFRKLITNNFFVIRSKT